MEKKDLKIGTVVELRDGSRFMVMPIPNTDITNCFLVNTESFMSINYYSNDLYHESSVFKDIMKVYHPNPDDLEHMLHCLTERIIWRRQEIDWSAFTEDTKVLVLMEGKWKKAYFSHVDEHGIHIFANGKSSFTANDDDDNFIVDVEDIVLYKKE